MTTVDSTPGSISEALRNLAREIRSVAGTLPDPVEKTAATIELDPEKVRDFLIFFGDRH
ncbi:hypothetical protein [Desulfovibrio piger]|uniref:hypothetical protein n=1 Tax=Desulfovibrio piger TaxID=901 RepID=UPI0012DF6315|nr:hypothetical protein [Desulfovibrio piger]DAR55037.1 MAG TPA: hypothetical protein [Caudoviricetes sp.]